jgi:hypothetical protein
MGGSTIPTTTTTTPSPSPSPIPLPPSSMGGAVGGMGGAMGGSMGGGNGAETEEAQEEGQAQEGQAQGQAQGKFSGGQELEKSNKYFGLLGLLIGAAGGYFYAKKNNKNLVSFALIGSAIGVGIGLIIQNMKDKNELIQKSLPQVPQVPQQPEVQTTDESFINAEAAVKAVDTRQREEIGDGFFKVGNNLYKKYIDGTIQTGLLIDASGNVPLGETETVDLGGGAKMDRKKLIPYPKNKGIIKADGKGNFYYFEELSDLVKGEIARLNKLQSDKSAEANRKILLQKAESDKAEAKKVIAESKLAETDAQSKEAEAKAKTKKAIIGGSVVVLVAGFFIYKKFSK